MLDTSEAVVALRRMAGREVSDPEGELTVGLLLVVLWDELEEVRAVDMPEAVAGRRSVRGVVVSSGMMVGSGSGTDDEATVGNAELKLMLAEEPGGVEVARGSTRSSSSAIIGYWMSSKVGESDRSVDVAEAGVARGVENDIFRSLIADGVAGVDRAGESS